MSINSKNFSPDRKLIEQHRLDSRDKLDSGYKGRLGRAVGKRDVISNAYRDLMWRNPEGLLQMPYLASEIMALKKVIIALQNRPNDPDCVNLARKLRLEGASATPTSILCPIARHLRSVEMQLAMTDFLHETTKDQWYFVTIIHGKSDTLEDQEAIVDNARRCDQIVRDTMLKNKAGLIEVGSFEPDLRHVDEFRENKTLDRLSGELGWEVTDAGVCFCVQQPQIGACEPTGGI